jgi:hypothetical protein
MRTVPRSRAARVVVAVLTVIVVGGVAGILAGCSGGSHPAGAIQAQSPSSQPASSPTASSAGASAGQTAGSLCNSQRRAVVGGVYMTQNDEWGSGAPECVAVATGGGFTVATSAIAKSGGSPGGYPSIYRGCHWGVCTPDSGLPVPASKLLSPGTVTTSWATTQPSAGAYDVAYDIWFNQAPTTSGQPNGAELMIWLNHKGSIEPYGSQVGTATIDGRSYQVWFGQQGWNTISYSMTTGTTSVQDLDIGKFVADAMRRGWIQKSWYLIDVEAGFELWQGGVGLATDSFAVNVPGDRSAPAAAN